MKPLFLFILLSSVSFAQKPTEKALLWEISGNGLAESSYLFGTIHMICASDFELKFAVKEKLAASRQLALELDMDDPKMMVTMMQHMNMTDGSTIKAILEPSDYQKLSKYYKDSIGMDISFFQNAKPFVLMGPMLAGVLGCEPKSFETELMNLAKSKNLEVIGVETVEEQLSVFDSIPYRTQAKMLLDLIANMPKAKMEFQDLISLYKAEDIDHLLVLSEASEFGMEAQAKVLLYDRNERWIARFAKAMSEMPTFFAVGAAHLGGDLGVISLLRKRGYTVNPVTD